MARITDLEQELREKDSQLSKLKASFDWHEARLRQAGEENRDLRASNDALSEENRDLCEHNADLDELTDQLQETLNEGPEPLTVRTALPGFRLRVALEDGALDVEFAPDAPAGTLVESSPWKPDLAAMFAYPGLNDEEDDE